MFHFFVIGYKLKTSQSAFIVSKATEKFQERKPQNVFKPEKDDL